MERPPAESEDGELRFPEFIYTVIPEKLKNIAMVQPHLTFLVINPYKKIL